MKNPDWKSDAKLSYHGLSFEGQIKEIASLKDSAGIVKIIPAFLMEELKMKELTCCFTGHRVLPMEGRERIRERLEAAITGLIQRGYHIFCAGGALGFDTMAAQTVLRLKAAYPQIRLCLFLPCKDQTRRWSEEDCVVYNAILAQADEVRYVSERYFSGCMQKRNRALVDASSVCVCCLTEETGGTAYTVKYAQRKGLEIINIGK